jgi:hypothetical protein
MKLENFISEMQLFRSANEKIRHLKRYDSPLFRELMDAAYNPMRRFNVLIKSTDIKNANDPGLYDLFEMEEETLTVLSECELCESPAQNKQRVQTLMDKLNHGSRLFLQGVLNKRLKCGVGQKTVLKAFPDLYKPFNPQKGRLYDHSREYDVPYWIATPKYNGIRCVALFKNGFWKLHTFVGHEIHTCSHLIPNLESLRTYRGYTMVDGELYNHELTYNQIESAVLSANDPEAGVRADICLYAFNVGVEEYFSKEEDRGFEPEYDHFDFEHLLSSYRVRLYTKKDVKDMYEDMVSDGYEGLVLRKPGFGYIFGKSHHMLKVKKDCFGDLDISDCRVLDTIWGEYPFSNPEGGYTYRETLIALLVKQPNGLTCKVGTFKGFSNKFREDVYHGKIELLNTIVEIEHEGFGDQGRMNWPKLYRTRHPKDKV